MCERCNPLGLKQPASSQAHGTVFLGIVIAVVGLALLGRFAMAGIGPFTGQVVSVVSDPPNLVVTLTVHNDGSRVGSTTCRVFDAADSAHGSASAFVVSPDVPPGGAISFSKQVGELGTAIRSLQVECSQP
jgi:hypothetical protein